ncbi:MAG: rhamnan synthesis F family protein [Prolixibacteraceae bacterium]|jgi:lipopolysaccharide biosynthesis protein
MKIIQKSLCVFVHYSNDPYIPNYVLIYITEISKFFDKVILVTNERPIEKSNYPDNLNISTLFVKNEGYDLGMFYKAFQTIDPNEYKQIACINDSNVLFNELHPIFNWSKKQNVDFWGVIDSYQKPEFSTHQTNYHIQSHFIVFNEKAISRLPHFFETLKIHDIFAETDAKKLRQTVINKWEIGLSQFLINEGLTCSSYIDSKAYSQKYLSGKPTNVGLKLYPELIRSGLPLLKIKVITKGKWKDIFRTDSSWENLIRKYGNQEWKIESLIDELSLIKHDLGNQPLVKLRRKFDKLIHKKKAIQTQ